MDDGISSMSWRYRLKSWAWLPADTAMQGNYGVLANGSRSHVWTWRIPNVTNADLSVDVWTPREGEMAAPVTSTIIRPSGVHTQAGQELHIAPGRLSLAWKPAAETFDVDVKVRSYEVTESGASLVISADIPMIAAFRTAHGGLSGSRVEADISTWYDRDTDQLHVKGTCWAEVGTGTKYALVYSRVNADGTYTAPYAVTPIEAAGGPVSSSPFVDTIPSGPGVPRLGNYVSPFLSNRIINNVAGEPIYWAHGWIDFGPTSATIHKLDSGIDSLQSGGWSGGAISSRALNLTNPARSSGDLAHFIWSVVPHSQSGLPRRRFAGVKGNAALEVPTDSNIYGNEHIQSHTVVPNSSGAYEYADSYNPDIEQGSALIDLATGPDEWYYRYPFGEVFKAGDRLQVSIGDPSLTGFSNGLHVFLSDSPLTMVYRGDLGGTASDSNLDWIDHPFWTLPDDYPHGAPVAPAILIVEHLPAPGWLVGMVGFNS